MQKELTVAELIELHIENNQTQITNRTQRVKEIQGVMNAWLQMGNAKVAQNYLEELKFNLVMIARHEENLKSLQLQKVEA